MFFRVRERDTRHRSTRRRAFSLASAVVVGSAISLNPIAVPAASAWNPIGCQWNHKHIRYYAPSPLVSATTWTGAAALWAGLNATLTNTSSNVDVYATNENYGNSVGWTGITRKKGTFDLAPPCNANGYWVSGKMEVVINWGLVQYLGYGNPKKKMVAAHEFGHAFGLDHTPNHPGWLMYPSDTTRTTKVPVHNDKVGVNALYS